MRRDTEQLHAPTSRIRSAVEKERESDKKLAKLLKILGRDMEKIGKIEKVVQYTEKHPGWYDASKAARLVEEIELRADEGISSGLQSILDELVHEIEDLEKGK